MERERIRNRKKEIQVEREMRETRKKNERD
jgi:hypothetical protein